MAQNRYTILHKLAEGGMAEIYLGHQHGAAGFLKPVVLKRIRPEFGSDPSFRTMLLDEVHISMQLIHGHVVQVNDVGVQNGQLFQVLELVDGWDVETLVKRAQAAGLPLPPSLAFFVAAQVCRALAYVHSRERDGQNLGIVHRDVSPENVLVSDEGDVKLADFGIATAFNKKDRTSAGVVKGKLGFMSPEQASGLRLDGRSDLFSVGCVLYVMLSGGQKPFAGKTDLETLIRQQQGATTPLRQVAPNLPAEVLAVVERAMQQFPEKRFSSAADMLHEVERVQRTVLEPLGQTELKAWLADLLARDGAQPTSKRPPMTAAEEVPVGTEVISGTSIILQDLVEEVRAQAGWSTRRKVLAAGASALGVALGAVAWRSAVSEEGLEFEVDESGNALSDQANTKTSMLGTVSVRFVSEPKGATVVVNGRTFGTTPMGIRFRPGLTHEVFFRKEGYAEQFQRVYVSQAKGQVVEASLSKVPSAGRR